MAKKITAGQVTKLDVADLRAMTIPELHDALRAVAGAANKRIKALQSKPELYSISVHKREVQVQVGHIESVYFRYGAKHPSEKESYISAIKEAKSFLNSESSTISGARNWEKEVRTKSKSDENANRMWQIATMLQEFNPSLYYELYDNGLVDDFGTQAIEENVRDIKAMEQLARKTLEEHDRRSKKYKSKKFQPLKKG